MYLANAIDVHVPQRFRIRVKTETTALTKIDLNVVSFWPTFPLFVVQGTSSIRCCLLVPQSVRLIGTFNSIFILFLDTSRYSYPKYLFFCSLWWKEMGFVSTLPKVCLFGWISLHNFGTKLWFPSGYYRLCSGVSLLYYSIEVLLFQHTPNNVEIKQLF